MKLTLSNIRFHAFHGCMQQERVVGGEYLVSITMHLPTDERALCQDNLEGTVNYAAVYKVIKEEMEKPSNLIEHVAQRIARHVLDAFPAIETLDVSLTKLSPPIPGATLYGATVEITMQR
ncbi:MAG: dihydroneopterin aldolase [Alloprevotella sp.]|nr:dihydroneopterin aldolase [Alloprevotella sp.]